MKRNEQGIALVVTLFLMASLSALAVSLMFLSQTETASSRNYRTMSQARYGGEAGVHKTINYLLNSYTAPSSFSNYDLSVSPVTCLNNCAHTVSTGAGCNFTTSTTAAQAAANGCIVLSGMSGVTSNYPDSSFLTSSHLDSPTSSLNPFLGTLAVNSSGSTTNTAAGTVTYGAAAILMSMQSFSGYGSTSSVIQMWKIISDGTVPGAQPATVEVTAMLDQDIADADTFAAFATGTGCGAITLGGTVETQSYDSSVGTTLSDSGGNVGTNGNLSIGGHVDVHGSLSTPRTGVGACTDGAVTALTESGSATVDNNALVQLPQTVVFPTPTYAVPPNTYPPTTATTSCTAVYSANPSLSQLVYGNWCTTVSGTVTITPPTAVPFPGGTTLLLGNVSGNFALNGFPTSGCNNCSYAINSIGNGSNTQLSVVSAAGRGNVTVNLIGRNADGSQMADPFDTNGQAMVNSSMNAAALQVLYAGTGTINMTGGSSAAMVLYAPNASVVTHGNGNIYGSVLAASITSSGTPAFVYDRHLSATMHVAGNHVMTAFNWKKY